MILDPILDLQILIPLTSDKKGNEIYWTNNRAIYHRYGGL